MSCTPGAAVAKRAAEAGVKDGTAQLGLETASWAHMLTKRTGAARGVRKSRSRGPARTPEHVAGPSRRRKR